MSQILVADDEPIIRMTIVESLADAGYTVTTARNGAEALARALELPADIAKSLPALIFRALDDGGVGDAPMRGDRIARPDRADFAGGLVADGKDEIHHRRTGTDELVPALAAQTAGRQSEPLKKIERQRVHRAFREAAGAVALEPAGAPMVEQNFGEDAPRRVAGAQEQDVVDRTLHRASGQAASPCPHEGGASAPNTAELLQLCDGR